MITLLPIHIVLSFFPTILISILMTTNKIYITQEGNLFLVKRHQDCSLTYLERNNQWIRLSSHHSLVDKLLPPLFTVAPTKTLSSTHLDSRPSPIKTFHKCSRQHRSQLLSNRPDMVLFCKPREQNIGCHSPYYLRREGFPARIKVPPYPSWYPHKHRVSRARSLQHLAHQFSKLLSQPPIEPLIPSDNQSEKNCSCNPHCDSC